MKRIALACCAVLTVSLCVAQQNYYDVTIGVGNGIRFWQDPEYKIHMGNTSEYLYGPVTDYSIKVNMAGGTGRGWTWGASGATPVAALNTQGHMRIAGTFTSNSIGVSTASPRGSLDVASGDIYLSTDPNSGSSQTVYLAGHIMVAPLVSTNWSYVQARRANDTGSTNFMFRTLNSGALVDAMSITSNGNIGIGVGQQTPDAKLTVKGRVHAQEVVVDLNGTIAPDYVFKDAYKLPSLRDIKAYIDQHQHLPEVPSAEQMERNGVNVGEMNLLLLKKVEELTLYAIGQEERNNKQQEIIDALLERVKQLENK